MATGEGNPEHSQSQDSGGAGDDKKLYAGKYKSPEELERAYKELERGYHESNERFSRLEEKFDQFSSRLDEGYGRGESRHTVPQETAGDNDRVLREFYTDPTRVLSTVEERAVRRAKMELTKEQQQVQDHAARVNGWLSQNQDIAAYPELLTYHVGQTDGRLSIERRLDQAAEKVRKRILELRGKPEEGDPDPEKIVEAPGGVSQGQGQSRSAPTQPAPSGESQLASYALQRNRTARKPLGIPRQK